jgi:hypothetical protein
MVCIIFLSCVVYDVEDAIMEWEKSWNLDNPKDSTSTETFLLMTIDDEIMRKLSTRTYDPVSALYRYFSYPDIATIASGGTLLRH